MAHQLETILAQIVTLLKAAATDAGQSVYRARSLPVEAAEGDVILLYAGDELAEGTLDYVKPRAQQLTLELHKRDLPADVNDPAVDTALNEFYRQVEIAIEASNPLGTNMWFEHTGSARSHASAERDYAVLTIGLTVHYRTRRTDPAVQA